MNDEDNKRLMQQNSSFQHIASYEQMIRLIYLSPEETPDNDKPIFLQDIMKQLSQAFPTFKIGKYTDRELGKKLVDMGYKAKRQNKGMAYQLKERSS